MYTEIITSFLMQCVRNVVLLGKVQVSLRKSLYLFGEKIPLESVDFTTQYTRMNLQRIITSLGC